MMRMVLYLDKNYADGNSMKLPFMITVSNVDRGSLPITRD
jgi:hypothetical protein